MPWGAEAFAAAKSADLPIFLSIGYSTCHWCHVMERESFENRDTAAILNSRFISIKVDREERPDVDKVYMAAVQSMGIHGGWPLSVWLTPDLQPFYGGTYFPPCDNHGRPGFSSVLLRIAELWVSERDRLLERSRDLFDHLQTLSHSGCGASTVAGPETMPRAASHFLNDYDAVQGGFGQAPKFPRPSTLLFLLRYAQRHHDASASDAVIHTLDRMARGGICDQLGGGFSRYSVDDHWLVPHFEKMLYDNAQLLSAYAAAMRHIRFRHGETPESLTHFFTAVIQDTAEYILRDMTSPEGGFYSAEDADSEGREGAFYVWDPSQIRQALTAKEAEFATHLFGVTEQGNFSDHSFPGEQPASQSVLSLHRTPADAARGAGLDAEDTDALWRRVRSKLLTVRQSRERPLRDDKILVSWNGLMIAALADAGSLLRDTTLISAAVRAADFIWNHLRLSDGNLLHFWKDGPSTTRGLLDDYAFFAEGLLQLHRATLDGRWLERADQVAVAMLQNFSDPRGGAFYLSCLEADTPIRLKEDYDGAEPSGNAVAALALLQLSRLLDKPGYRDAAEEILAALTPRLERMPEAVPHLLCALDRHHAEPVRLSLAGPDNDPLFQELLASAHAAPLPDLCLLKAGGDHLGHSMSDTSPPSAQLCDSSGCYATVQRVFELDQLLAKIAPAP